MAKKKKMNRFNIEDRCKALGFRTDAMCKECAEPRLIPSRSAGGIRRARSDKKNQEYSRASYEDFYGGEDMYSGPLGPPEEE